MQALLALSRVIDAVNEKLGVIADWLVLLSCLISAGNAFSRYAFSISSNAWLEIQWYMFGALVLLGASYTLKKNEHVRVDIVYSNVSTRRQIWIDIVGGILFPIGVAIVILKGPSLIVLPIVGSLIVVAATALFALIVFRTAWD